MFGSAVETAAFIRDETKAITVLPGQSGTLNEGERGQTAAFGADTKNFADGTYAVAVEFLEDKLDAVLAVSGGAGTLTLTVAGDLHAGAEMPVNVIYRGGGTDTRSNTFLLKVDPPLRGITVTDTQSGALNAGFAGAATFPVETRGFASGTYTVRLAADAGTPDGVSVGDYAAGDAAVTVRTSAAAPEGVYYIRIVIDGAESNTFTLTIGEPLPIRPALKIEANGLREGIVAGQVVIPLTVTRDASGGTPVDYTVVNKGVVRVTGGTGTGFGEEELKNWFNPGTSSFDTSKKPQADAGAWAQSTVGAAYKTGGDIGTYTYNVLTNRDGGTIWFFAYEVFTYTDGGGGKAFGYLVSGGISVTVPAPADS
jgi:hypothetical protein